MSYPPEISAKEKEVLEILGRGHPDRRMTATHRNNAAQVPALTWAEIQIALNTTHGEIGDAVAKLVANKLIDSGRQDPSFWGRLRGDKETYYFWITETGKAHLKQENVGQKLHTHSNFKEIKTSSPELGKVELVLIQLGYDITPYGVGVALLSLESGYSAAETASHLALVTLAHDCNSTDNITIFAVLFEHAMSMIRILSEYNSAGRIRDSEYKNDATAILKVATVDKDQKSWIDQVLSDPLIQKDRVATSRINYKEMVDLYEDEVDP
jgi:hypothetical protein